MTEFENVLQDCLLSMERGESNVEECLRRHPQHALQLEPILLTGLDLERGREARPSAAFKARVRTKLIQEMRAHPRKSIRFNFMLMRMVMSFAMLLLAFLIAGTVYAQRALPGHSFYSWKRASETIWRLVSPDPVGTDLALADRRAEELIAIGNNSEQQAQILEAYLDVVHRLELEMNAGNETRIRQTLDSQIDELNESGIILPQLDRNILPELVEPTPISSVEAPMVNTQLPQDSPTLPIPIATASLVQIQETTQVNPTDSPEIVPTLKVETDIVPTVQVPSLLP